MLDIRVFEVEELSKPAVVSPGGTISLPLIGEVLIGHMTTLEIEARLKQLYAINLLQDPPDQCQRAGVSQPAGQCSWGRGATGGLPAPRSAAAR